MILQNDATKPCLTIDKKKFNLNGKFVNEQDRPTYPDDISKRKRNSNLLNTSVKSDNFGDYIIRTKDSNGNEIPERTLISFNCIAFSLQLDTNKIIVKTVKYQKESTY